MRSSPIDRAETGRPSASGQRWQVQILAGRSLELVEEDRRLFSQRYSGLLDGLSLAINRSGARDDRNAFYRLRVLDWADPTEAANWCAELRARGHDCLVIRVDADGARDQHTPF